MRSACANSVRFQFLNPGPASKITNIRVRKSRTLWENPLWNTFDPLIIDRVDLIKGPSSVLYGTDAVSGAVKVTSRGRDPDFPEIEGRRFGSVHRGRRLYYRSSSGEDSYVVRTETSGSLRRQSGSPRRLHLWGLRRHPRRQAHGNAR